MPSYPHYKPGDQRPNDKLIILEDTNNDGKADKETVFADKLHLPIGFEFAPEGVYISQSENLKLLIDSNGDDKADKEEIILSGFDDHDTHHAISAFCADPSGALLMLEGIFLHTNVETAYGTVRASNGGMYRYNPTRRHLERYAQIPIPNPWGLAYDDWGQDIFAETSGPDVRWLMPSSIKPVYGIGSPKSPALVEEKYRVRPTSGLEFVSSRHFPDCMQSDFLINNTIGFLGMKQHKLWDDSTGYKSAQRQDLIKSTDPNFRPVDMEFAPDGSLYLIDWHNVLIGHMQHNARDPLRDHVHGKVYRITCEGRPLVTPAKVHGASIEELLDNLKLPEYRTRYRTKRELRGRDAVQVLKATKDWVAKLDPRDKNYERYLLEALWVTWGMNKVDHDILKKAAAAKDFRVRAAVVNVIRYMYHQIPDYKSLLEKMANDDHGRVRLASVVAGSWMDKSVGTKILDIAEKKPIDRWMAEVYASVKANFASRIKKLAEGEHENDVVSGLKGNDLKLLQKGRTLYGKEGNCVTCHQIDGNGLPSSGFPPLAASEWIKDEKKLVQVTLNGLMGPISVKGQKYEGRVPMMAYGKLMTDEDIAAIATYVRRSWGNREPPVQPETVAKIRKETASKQGYYQGSELQ
jgi:mono/diheme cytochrome c family protein